MMLTASILLAGLAPSASSSSQLTPSNVSDVVAAAKKCFEAVTKNDVMLSRLTEAGWVEVLDSDGKPETEGGHLFRHPGISAEIAVVGSVCSLVAPVRSFEDVRECLTRLGDVISPEKIEERREGIVLRKDKRSILFWVGSPTTREPAAVRIDTAFSETQ